MELYSTLDVANFVSLDHRSIYRLILKKEDILSSFGNIKYETIRSDSGQHIRIALLNKKQLSYIATSMKRKADIKSLLKNYDINLFYLSNRLESSFYNIILPITAGFCKDYILCREYKVQDSRVDYALFYKNKDINSLLAIIEYDESEHKYQKNLDNFRLNSILKHLQSIRNNKTNIITIRISEKNETNGIKEYVKMLKCLMFKYGLED